MTRLVLLALAAPAIVGAQQAPTQGASARRPISFDDFAAVHAVADPQPSPDGATILYTVRVADVAANRRSARTVAVAAAGGSARPFPAADVQATEARWAPDGRRVAYIAGGQLWVAAADGSAPRKLTDLEGGATGPVWSPDGARLAFTSSVWPECASNACNVARDSARDASKVKAHVADQLMFRHWTAWDDGTRSHLFVVATDGSGTPRDLTPGVRYDVPPGPFGGSEGYAWSPDGSQLAYSAKDQGRNDATTTDVNLYLVPSAGGAAPSVITAANRGADQNPVWSPDGRFIAYQSQARAGFESDRWRLMLWDVAGRTTRELLPRWDRNADAYVFAPDGRTLYVTAVDRGRTKLFRVAFEQGTAGSSLLKATTPVAVVTEHNNAAFALSGDGRTFVWLRDAADRPAEVWAASVPSVSSGSGALAAHQVTHENDALVAQLAVNPAEDFWFRGAGGDSVQAFLVKPPNWQPGQKYPAVLLIHGGPQGEWLDQWHGRWNYQMFAAPGFALVIVNPRGSFGYGQKFVDDVSRGWGGKVYTDLMHGLDAALQRYPWLDRTRLGAAGGSFGGYMVNWIAGHTDRFRALVSHAGPFNLENMALATEELWFPLWEYGSITDPAAMAQQYRKYSPHLYVRNFRTPTLVTGGELDFRVPYTEDLSMFTALQLQHVPSRLVIFPDEGHWIGKPQNQRLWWGEVQGWLSRYLKGQPNA